eukprot:m.192671 g.192671  ORF g.192671 m.192671 type:complete len:1403 (-) comp15170_c0_seq2:34-4242(-)
MSQAKKTLGQSSGQKRVSSTSALSPVVPTGSVVCKYIGSETIAIPSSTEVIAGGSPKTSRRTKYIEEAANGVVRQVFEANAPNASHVMITVDVDNVTVQGVGGVTLSKCSVNGVAYCGKGSTTPTCFTIVSRRKMMAKDTLLCQVFQCKSATLAHENVNSLARALAAFTSKGALKKLSMPTQPSTHTRSASQGNAAVINGIRAGAQQQHANGRPGHQRAQSTGGRASMPLPPQSSLGFKSSSLSSRHSSAGSQSSEGSASPKSVPRSGATGSGTSSPGPRSGGASRNGSSGSASPKGVPRSMASTGSPPSPKNVKKITASKSDHRTTPPKPVRPARSMSSPTIEVTEASPQSTPGSTPRMWLNKVGKKLTSANLGSEVTDLNNPKSPCGLLDDAEKAPVKRRTPTTVSAGGCLIRAWYIGERSLRVPARHADGMASKIAQRKANEVIDGLLQDEDSDSPRHRVSISVRTEFVRVLYEETKLVIADIPRVRVRTCAGGQGDAKEFFAVSSRDHVDGSPETKRRLEADGIPFTYRVFQCESELEAKMALDALARAFGASDTANRLSAALSSAQVASSFQSTAVIEKVFIVSYYGFMELVSSNMKVSIQACAEIQTERVAAAACEIRLGPTTIEFYDTDKMALAKWFPLEDIDSVSIHGLACAILLCRGSWKKVRFCCYIVTVESPEAAAILKASLTERVSRRRSDLREQALGSVLSHLHLNLKDESEAAQSKREDMLQAEVNRLKEEYQTSLNFRFKANDIEDRFELLLCLLAQMYTACKSSELRQNRGLLGKPPKRSTAWSLSTSVENLLGKRLDRRRSRAKSTDDYAAAKNTSPTRTEPSSLSTGVTAQSPERSPSTSASAASSPVGVLPMLLRKPSGRSLRQDLFRSVAGKDPREATPRRERVPLTLEPVEPVNIARQRWVKAVQQQLLLIRMAKENDRIEDENDKIRTMTNERAIMNKWEDLLKKPPTEQSEAEIRACLREGVPPKIRRRYWQSMEGWLMASTERTLPEPEYSYIDLVVQPAIYWHAIKIDLERTFPTNPYYREGGKGLRALFQVMKAYSNYDTTVGYCQGMGFIAGLLLNQLTEEKAFHLLLSVMYRHRFRHQYAHDMADLKVQLYQFNRLLLDHLPAISNLLQEFNVEPFLYATSWFLTLFCAQFPLDFCNFVLDNVLLEGMTFVFKVALALFTVSQDEICACTDFETVLLFIQKQLPQRNHSDVIQMARQMTIVTPEVLDDYAHEYELLHSTMGELAFEKGVSKDDQIQLLMDRLLGQDKASRTVHRELELCKQQLNHAKSAVQGLTLENEKLEKEVQFYRRMHAENTFKVEPKKEVRRRSIVVTSGPVRSPTNLDRRASAPSDLVDDLVQEVPRSDPGPAVKHRRRISSVDPSGAAITNVVQEAQF